MFLCVHFFVGVGEDKTVRVVGLNMLENVWHSDIQLNLL